MNTSTNESRTLLSLTSLGDIRAEFDHAMLDQAFLETPDYRTLLESAEGKVVVGRRGTGKSALTYRLTKHWAREKSIIVITLAAEEDQVIGVRPLLQVFGHKFQHIRAGARLIWRYALLLELGARLSARYKSSKAIASSEVMMAHLKRWRSAGPNVFTKLRNTLRSVVASGIKVEEAIGDLAAKLQIHDLEAALTESLAEANCRCIILIDKLDEGYQHDTLGIGFVDGVIYALSDLDSAFPQIKTLVFLRDNIFRAIAHEDPDFSRNIEGQTLRLHWDTYQLFNLVCNRLRKVFSLDIENSQRVWDRCAANELQHQDGFKKCLQMTLYRPRDILLLLNQAFHNAGTQGRSQIVLADIDATAKHISNSRLSDLHKEYESILPGLSKLTMAFTGYSPELTVEEATTIIGGVLSRDDFGPEIQQEFALFRKPEDQLRSLYSVGFLGIDDKDTTSFIFCHDGKQPDRGFRLDDRVLIHPCYWLALNLTRNTLDPAQAEEINDEYEIEVSSQTPQLRHHKLGQMIAALDKIPLGSEGASEFEEWCAEAVRIAFAGKLRNVQLHPNKNAIQRRDIVATNLATSGAWKRIYDDYRARQVIFEVKNCADIGLDEYRQLLSYLCNDYGKLGFIITRATAHTLTRGVDIDHFLEMYHKHDKIMIVKLTGKFLCTILSKLRNPQKHDEPDNLVNKLLDHYSRVYLSGQFDTPKKK